MWKKKERKRNGEGGRIVRRSKKREGGCMSVTMVGRSKNKGRGVRGWWGKKKGKKKNVVREW